VPPDSLTALGNFTHAAWQVGDVGICEPEPSPESNDKSKLEGGSSNTDEAKDGKGEGKTPQGSTSGSGGSGEKRTSHVKISRKRRPAGRNYRPPAQARREKEKQKKVEQRERRKQSDIYNCGIVSRTHTRLDVLWQDASWEEGIESVSLIPVKDLLDSDFWPDDFVQEVGESMQMQILENATEGDVVNVDEVSGKATSLSKMMANIMLDGASVDESVRAVQLSRRRGHRLGIIRKVDAAARTCVVRWLAEEVGEQEAKRDEGETSGKDKGKEKEEEVSFYSIMLHPDFKYRVGDIVLRLADASNPTDSEPSSSGSDPATTSTSSSSTSTTTSSAGNNDAGRWVGQLVKLDQGKLVVKWADGSQEHVGPQEIYALDRYALAIYDYLILTTFISK
jgi:hypothetical protein